MRPASPTRPDPSKEAAGQQFFNASPFTLRDLRSVASRQQLRANFEAYLDGFSPNVQDILEKFEFRNQVGRLSNSDALGALIERFLSPYGEPQPHPVLERRRRRSGCRGWTTTPWGPSSKTCSAGSTKRTTRKPANTGPPGTPWNLWRSWCSSPSRTGYRPQPTSFYDGALGTGGMLTVAEQTLQEMAERRGERVSTHLYGQEINSETYAICKADLLLKGEGDTDANIIGGPEHSTLSNDAFRGRQFDFMLSNPPYGKSWKTDQDRMGGRSAITDPRFVFPYNGDPAYSLITRSSDGQLMFLANMLSKMKEDTPLGSRVAEVHNGSSLFTGDAGQGESNIRRWIIENDWLEAIVALPLNMFYNTGIATYVWVLTNRKPEHRKGFVQLIDATQWYTPLRRNLGQKNCELSPDNIQQICDAFMDFQETEQSKIFPNEAFGYWKVTVERPLRIEGIDPEKAHTAKEIRELRTNGTRSESAPPVIKKIHGRDAAASPLNGLMEATIKGRSAVVEYEPDPDLRDTEQIPLLHEGGIDAFLEREVLPYAPDAWYLPAQVKVGYEISFTRHFYKPKPMRTLEEIRADILALERESEGLLEGILAR